MLFCYKHCVFKKYAFQCDYKGPLSRQMSVPDAGFPVMLDNLGKSEDEQAEYKVTA
jgi:hypothetical protein